MLIIFFFQAEDGIRDYKVTGVQTCALPISFIRRRSNLSCCVVACGALAAWGAGLLRAQPANDLFANRTFISGTNLLVTGSNIGATGEVGEPMHAGVDGGKSVWWSWTAPFSGRT